MPQEFSYRLTPLVEYGFFWASFEGEVSLRNLGDAHKALRSHALYEPGINELLDFRKTSIETLSRRHIEAFRATLVEMPDRQHNRSVIVINTDLEYGLARMLSGMLDLDVPVDRHVCFDVEEALNWLQPGKADEIVQRYKQVGPTI